MNKTTELTESLKQVLDWNKARLTCLSMMILALLSARTICLSRLALLMDSQAQSASRYQRVKRFFREFTMDMKQVAYMIYGLFAFKGKPVYLTMDRTNWFFGKAKINVFTLGICHEGIAIPLFWQLLPKAGNAKATEHIGLIARFLDTFGKDKIVGVLGDREFANRQLFRWLDKQDIPFYIRIKDGSRIQIKGKKWLPVKKLFKHLNQQEQTVYGMKVTLWRDCSVFLAGSRSARGELMVVATNRTPGNAVAIYLRRWEIENLFQALKGRGFQFEDTHVTALDRLEKLMALLALAFCWAHKVGEWRAERQPITLNQHRDSRRPQYTYFRYGLDWLQEVIIGFQQGVKQWRLCLKQLDFHMPPFTQEISS